MPYKCNTFVRRLPSAARVPIFTNDQLEFHMSTTRTLLRSALVIAAAGAAANSYAQDESTTIGGRLFIDLTDVTLKNDDVKQPSDGYGVDVKRGYLIVQHNFDKTWAANLTTDFNYVSNDGETQLFVKKAYVQGKVSDALIGRLGAADTPWIPYVEDLYGYRYVEQVITDRLKFGTSSDWGLNANGKTMNSRVNYSVSLVNGGGYKNPTRSKGMDEEGRIGFMAFDGFTITLGFYNGKLGKDIEGSATPAVHTASREDAMVTYVKKSVRVGLEYFSADNWNQVTTAAKDKADGYSVWGSFDFSPKYGIFARADNAKLSKTLNPALEDKYYNAGFAIHARKNVDFSLVYKHEDMEHGSWNTANGVIGGKNTGKYDEFGIWCLVNF